MAENPFQIEGYNFTQFPIYIERQWWLTFYCPWKIFKCDFNWKEKSQEFFHCSIKLLYYVYCIIQWKDWVSLPCDLPWRIANFRLRNSRNMAITRMKIIILLLRGWVQINKTCLTECPLDGSNVMPVNLTSIKTDYELRQLSNLSSLSRDTTSAFSQLIFIRHCLNHSLEALRSATVRNYESQWFKKVSTLPKWRTSWRKKMECKV